MKNLFKKKYLLDKKVQIEGGP